MSHRLNDLFHPSDFNPKGLDPLPVELSFFPEGWMLPLELTALYNLAKYGDDDLLEIGSWIGRSSTALAMGMRDTPKPGRRFDIVDLGIASMTEFMSRLMVGPEYTMQESISRPVMSPGGILGCLIENLRKRDLLIHTTAVMRGDVVTAPLRNSYGVVFCDAVHSEPEIVLTGPALARILRPGSWLMCDDLDKPELVAALERFVTFERKIALKDYDQNCKAMVGRVSATHT